MLSLPNSMTAFQVWQLNIKRMAILEDIFEKWDQAGIDVIICPAFGVPAQLIGYPGWLQIASSYTSVYNTLDFPAGSMPVRLSENLQKSENLIIFFRSLRKTRRIKPN